MGTGLLALGSVETEVVGSTPGPPWLYLKLGVGDSWQSFELTDIYVCRLRMNDSEKPAFHLAEFPWLWVVAAANVSIFRFTCLW